MLKTVIVEANRSFKILNKTYKPGAKMRVNTGDIFRLLSTPGVKVTEILDDGGCVKLGKENYDKDNNALINGKAVAAKAEAEKKAAEEAAKKAEEEKKAAEAAKVEEEKKAETAKPQQQNNKKNNKK